MNKKRDVIVLALISALIISLFCTFVATAAVNTTNTTNPVAPVANLSGFEKSYKCLGDSIKAKNYSSMSVEELGFSLLALGYDSTYQTKLKDELEKRRDAANCWPKSACTLRETSIVLLAYNHIGKDTKKIENWLLNQTAYSSELVWYLQIDSANKTECKITYDNTTRTVTVNEDKTITGSAGSCFNSAYNGYWLEIKNSCLGKEFEISCSEDFITSTFYKRASSSVYYISDQTNTAVASGKTKEKVESFCFKQSGTCNYEGSLWASFSLQKTLEKKTDIKKFLPYLITLAEDNKRFFASSFLYSMTGYDEYFSSIVNQQNRQGYWQISDTSKRYYDTSLALLSLYGKSTEQASKAIDYLLDPKVQGDGCWQNSIRDTAMILYATSPKTAYVSADSSSRTKCTDNSAYSCISITECDKLNGTEIEDSACFGGGICCSKKSAEKTCSELLGKKCLSSEVCDGLTLKASDTSYCCSGECKPENLASDTNECTSASSSNICKYECTSEEDEVSYSCLTSSEVCCSPKSTSSGGSLWWLWLLIILIIIIVLAIIFRGKIKEKFMKPKQSGVSSSPVLRQTRPPSPPTPSFGQRPMFGMPMRSMPRRIVAPGAMAQPRRPLPSRTSSFPKDKELDETLKKLKDMSK